MNMRYSALLAMVCLVASGCCASRCVQVEIDVLQGKLRDMEDYINQLEHEIQVTCEDLEVCQRENSVPKKQLGVSNANLPGIEAVPDLSPPPVELQPPDSPEDAAGGEIPWGVPPHQGPDTPAPTPAQLDPGEDRPVHSENDAAGAGAVDAQVTKVVFNPRLTGGYDLDGLPGDEGLLVVVEPRDANGRYLPLAGPVSVVVLDAEKEGAEARVGRWDFDTVATARVLRNTLLGRGIHLELPWPHTPPEHSRLRVFVRYQTTDGRELQADRDVFVAIPGQISNRWTPTTPVAGRLRQQIAEAPDRHDHAPAHPVNYATPGSLDADREQRGHTHQGPPPALLVQPQSRSARPAESDEVTGRPGGGTHPPAERSIWRPYR